MRKAILAGLLCVVAVTVPSRAQPPEKRVSPPGQISVVTLNAQQRGVLGLRRFKVLFGLARSLRARPSAFDGGRVGGVLSPDVLILQEIRQSNAEILARLLRQRYSARYLVATPGGMRAAIIYNSNQIDLIAVSQWSDVCTSADGTADQPDDRVYPIAQFSENTSATGFTVAGIHLAKNYRFTGQRQCFERNVMSLRAHLADEPGPVIVGGDFNRRAVVRERECDPNERSEPQPWWTLMTSLDGAGRSYIDAVRQWHRDHQRTLKDQWSHEQAVRTKTCRGFIRNRRSRIDFLFSTNALVAEAAADAPGWAGRLPGSRHRRNLKYSDHRFVWGRFVLAGPSPLGPLTVEPARNATMSLSWQAVPEATGYVVMRSLPGKSYQRIARLPATAVGYVDEGRHGQSYRYSLAVLGANGVQGRESRGSWGMADARGPRILEVSPRRRSTNIDRDTPLLVRFDEALDVSKVGDGAIRLWRGRNRIRGRLTILSPRLVGFDPARRLPGKKTFHVRVVPLWDRYGNRGPGSRWSFTTRSGSSRR